MCLTSSVTQTWLAIQTPIYTGGAVPATAGATTRHVRRVGRDPGRSERIADSRRLVGFPKMSVSMSYYSFSGDRRGHRGIRECRDRGSGRLDDHRFPATGGPSPRPVSCHARASSPTAVRCGCCSAGIAVSLLAGALMFVLATGRERARRLVAQRTGELRHQALHDALTGLPNRALVIDRVEQLLARGRRHATIGAALFIDVDDFKNVNDTLGHQAGDRLLVALAERLASTLRDADTIGRMGGDEFVVLVDGTISGEGPELVAERLLEAMRQPFEVIGASTPLIASISIGIATGDRSSSGELLRDADVALYQAKAAGKNRYEIFQADMQSTISRRLDLAFDLRSALRNHQYRLVYQPIYNLDDLTVVGVEALLRWHHPVEGLIRPDEFIPILEQTGQIRRSRTLGARDSVRPDGGLAQPGRPARCLGECLRSSARRRQPGRRRPSGADEQRITGSLAHRRSNRDRAHAQRRGNRPDGSRRSRPSASGSRSTTSVPATHRWPTCASSRSTASRSTGCSPTRSRRRRNRRRWWQRSSNSARTLA